MATLNSSQIKKIADLANLPISKEEEDLFADQFTKTIAVIDELNEVDTSGLPLTSSVTKLENVTRPDEVDHDRVLTQAQALSNAHNQHQGFFVVKQVISKDD